MVAFFFVLLEYSVAPNNYIYIVCIKKCPLSLQILNLFQVFIRNCICNEVAPTCCISMAGSV